MNQKSIFRAVLVFSLLASVVFGVFMTFSVANSAEDGAILDINAYSYDKVKYFSLISWLFVACLVGYLVLTFVFKSRFSKSLKFQTKSYKNICILGGCTAAGVILFALINDMFPFDNNDTAQLINGNVANSFYQIVKNDDNGASINLPYIGFLLCIAFSAVYFFSCVFSKRDRSCNYFAGLAMFPPLTLAIKLIIDFLTQNSNGYGQLYNYHLLSLGFFLLFFVNEIRFYMHKAAPALYVFFGLSAVLATSVFTIPVLLLTAMGIVETNSINLAFCFTDIAMAAYVSARFIVMDIKIPKSMKNGISPDEALAETERPTDAF